MSEFVNHPEHYRKKGRKECIVEMEELYGGEITTVFCLTNAYKYLYRAGDKDGNPKEQDVQKSKWYFEYANKLIGKYGDLQFSGERIRVSELYLKIASMIRD